MSYHLIGFLICSAIIFFAGKKLSYYGDLLAELSGLGKAWIGLILMAAVTSLPELMVGISSVTIVGSADLAVGDVLGSCAFNLGILSLMDVFLPKRQPLFQKVSRSHILAAAFGVILLALVGLSLFLEKDFVILPFIGATSFSFLLVYLIAVRIIFSYQQQHPATSSEQSNHNENHTLKGVIGRYALFASMIIITALALPFFAEHIAEETGLGKSFVGTLFLAVSTSLPEIAVSYAAIRMGSADMAVGNLMGSNIFNVLILFIDDLFYQKGHLLKDASDINMLSVFFVVMMSGVAIIGLAFPSREKKLMMAWDSLTIFALYIVNIVLLYLLTG